jgi:hypothetical protein
VPIACKRFVTEKTARTAMQMRATRIAVGIALNLASALSAR